MLTLLETPIIDQPINNAIAYVHTFLYHLEFGDTPSYELLETLAELRAYVDIRIESKDLSLDLKESPIRSVRMKGDLIELKISNLTIVIAELSDIQSLSIPKPTDLNELLETQMAKSDTNQKHPTLRDTIEHYQNIAEAFLF